MTKERKILQLIDNLVSTDIGFEADCISLSKNATEKEKQFAGLIMEIYTITHPLFSSCKHPAWEKETENKLKNL